MSNLNTSAEAQDANIRSNVHLLCFGYNYSNSKVKTLEFLESSKYVVTIIEKMGKVFAPLKYDMNGNITKITQAFNKNQHAYLYLEDMILTEKAAGDIVAVDALQWLRRGLHFIGNFFEAVLDDTDRGINEQNLVPHLKAAYEDILQRYHGWMGGQLFNILCRFAPTRKELYKIISSDESYIEEDLIRNMKVFKGNLLTCVNHLVKFYHDNNLETQAVV